MRKTVCAVFCILFVPCSAFAQEKTLYDIHQDMLTLVQSYIVCAENKGTCTEEDAVALKADAENGMRDLVGIVKTGRLRSMTITLPQARQMYARSIDLKERLAHIEFLDGPCNMAIGFIKTSFDIIPMIIFVLQYSIGMGVYPGLLIVILMFLLGFILTVGFFMTGIVLAPTCFFWWL